MPVARSDRELRVERNLSPQVASSARTINDRGVARRAPARDTPRRSRSPFWNATTPNPAIASALPGSISAAARKSRCARIARRAYPPGSHRRWRSVRKGRELPAARTRSTREQPMTLRSDFPAPRAMRYDSLRVPSASALLRRHRGASRDRLGGVRAPLRADTQPLGRAARDASQSLRPPPLVRGNVVLERELRCPRAAAMRASNASRTVEGGSLRAYRCACSASPRSRRARRAWFPRREPVPRDRATRIRAARTTVRCDAAACTVRLRAPRAVERSPRPPARCKRDDNARESDLSENRDCGAMALELDGEVDVAAVVGVRGGGAERSGPTVPGRRRRRACSTATESDR